MKPLRSLSRLTHGQPLLSNDDPHSKMIPFCSHEIDQIYILILSRFRGAALSKLPNNAIVTSISAVRHYGVQAGCIFDPAIDNGQRTYVDPFDGATKACRVRKQLHQKG